MKKIILAIAAVSFLFASCGESATADKKTDATPKTEAPKADAPKPEAAPAAAGTPKMSSPEAQKFVDEYTQYMKDAIAAAKSGDATKAAEFAKSAQDWGKKIQEFGSKLTPEDAKVWAEYMQKLAAEQTAAMTK